MSASPSSQTAFPPPNETDYPEQKHAGRVGLGPNYSTDADVSDKLKGLYEEAKGKLLHEPELVERGHARRIGEVKEKEKGKEKEGNDEKPPLAQNEAREAAGETSHRPLGHINRLI
ncbi:hypothetical protein JOM56_009591 [Amanita muscaria]